MTGRALLTLLALGAALAGLLVAGVLVGTAEISLGRVLAILSGGGADGGPAWEAVIVLRLRLPRVLVAALVGGGLALCGAVMQAIFRNPMAEPGVIGVSAGASLGAVLALYLGLAARTVLAVPGLAFLGAMVCAFAVYGIATRNGRTGVYTLLLAGIAVAALASSVTSFILSLALAEHEVSSQMVFWMLGGLDARSWMHVRIGAPVILGGALLLGLHARELNLLVTGEEDAMALGVDVPRLRRNLLLVASAVTATAVAVSGAIGFVGLVVPHVLRMLVGPDHRGLLPVSFVGGAAFLVAADLAARVVVAPAELQLGVVTSLVGGPFFIYLLVSHRRRVEEL